MNRKKSYNALELDKVLSMLAREATCKETEKLALCTLPIYDIDKVTKELQQTDDACTLIRKYGDISFRGLRDMSLALKRAVNGGLLTNAEFIAIAFNLKIFRKTRDWWRNVKEEDVLLENLLSSVAVFNSLEDDINTVVLSEDEISDEASSELCNIRRKIKWSELNIREKLDSMIKSATVQKYLQDPIITMRDSRFVLPVKSEYRAQVPGLVHDTSASGATLFIEPMNVVELNNDIRMLRAKEKIEIDRILLALSNKVGIEGAFIQQDYEACVVIDLLYAKARLAYKMKAIMPAVNKDGRIYLSKARHPLIPPTEVVPIDVELGKGFDTLLITGPNTGGKTVSLKTIGLLTLMAMCGLLIPAGDDSVVAVFDNIFVDVGDEQSIEQSLSTFSAHMMNIITIMEKVSQFNEASNLVLLDELGAGTDPIEGAALAIAILEFLQENKAKVVSTTHYAELKSFAITTDRVENACCEFDINTLEPTYKLLIGMPGSSNAFAISERLGIRHSIVEKAKQLITEENTKFEDMLKELERGRLDLEAKQKEAHNLQKEALCLRDKVKAEHDELAKERERLISDAHKEAARIVAKVNREAIKLIDELTDMKDRQLGISYEEKSALRNRINTLEKDADPIIERENIGNELPRELQVGDTVLIIDINRKGIVLSVNGECDNVFVQVGSMKTRVPIKNLRLLQEKPRKLEGKALRTVKKVLDTQVKRELDIRGYDSIEGVLELDRFIDSAVLLGVHQLTVITGKGTGALRKAVHQHLKKHPCVESYRLGTFGEGEAGVTVIELK